MKKNISLSDFIQQVKEELQSGIVDDSDKAFYELHEVNLEVTFAVDYCGSGKAKFLVVELESGATATQTHKVSLKLKPLPKSVPVEVSLDVESNFSRSKFSRSELQEIYNGLPQFIRDQMSQDNFTSSFGNFGGL